METSNKEKILELWREELLEVVETGDWISEGKYETCETIVLYEGNHYSIYQSRSGSYFSDYHNEEPSVYEVEPYQETVTKWRIKKK